MQLNNTLLSLIIALEPFSHLIIKLIDIREQPSKQTTTQTILTVILTVRTVRPGVSWMAGAFAHFAVAMSGAAVRTQGRNVEGNRC